MFRKAVSSMSYQVFLDLVVTDRVLSLTSYMEIGESDYLNSSNPGEDQAESVRSLQFNGPFIPGQLPPTASGVYHNRLPCVRLEKPLLKGEELDSRLAGRYFRAVSYSLLDLDDPSIRSGEKSDAAVWVCGVDFEGNMRPFYNAIAFETTTKMHPMRSVRNLGTPSNLFVYQPFVETPFTECSITLKYNLSLGYRSNIDGFVQADDYNYLPDMDTAFPKVELINGGGAVAADGYADVTVGLSSDEGKDATLYLEETGGYLPKKRVQTTDGLATFKVGALGLEPGDSFKVKVGMRNFNGMLDIPFEVVT